jgi:hypothetical protein
MSEEDQKLLKAIRDWRPPKTLHPIAMNAVEIYEANGKAMTPEAVQGIRDLLDGYNGDMVGLAKALEGLARFMILLTDHEKDKEGGEAVAALMREYTRLFEPFWKRVGEAATNVTAEARGSFLQFIDRDRTSEKAAPSYGQKAPKDTIPLSSIAPPARPPPWSKKKGGSK